MKVIVALTLLFAVLAEAKLKCIFFTGIGVVGPKDHLNVPFADRKTHPAFVKTELHEYWGNLNEDISPLCDGIFYFTDTISRGWDEPSLQHEFCDAIEHHKPDVVFTHSMGNLVVAGGVANGTSGCKKIGLGKDDINWYGSQGPLSGSEVIKVTSKVCNVPILKSLISKECKPTNGYGTLDVDYVSNKGKGQFKCDNSEKKETTTCVPLKVIASRKMKGSLCGFLPKSKPGKTKRTISEKAQAWMADLGLDLLEDMVKTATPMEDWDSKRYNMQRLTGNDGMVAASSCMLYTPDLTTRRSYLPNPQNLDYALAGNHGDGTTRFGDKVDPAVQPTEWFLHSIRTSAIEKGQFKPVFFEQETEIEEDEEEVAEEQETEEEEEEEEEEEQEEEELSFLEEASEEEAEEEESVEEEAEEEEASEEEAEEEESVEEEEEESVEEEAEEESIEEEAEEESLEEEEEESVEEEAEEESVEEEEESAEEEAEEEESVEEEEEQEEEEF